ncbi:MULTISPECIES: hypothetical protein [Chromohalobacter]|uniref:hypothetical protein n=1 Tax=Chromohalobacter TaxID=42054 RepID=UPI00105BD50D|nr:MULTISPECIES: hypothetical protein [Chromohalobacter]MCI0509241.1 hypothetical protein [Chromohalobacter sp.]MCI0592100.1 hypothetical protein [Chromohalobacter sp.]
MNGSILWIIFVFSGATFLALGFVLIIIGVILAPMIIHRADDALSVLLPENESLFKGLPLSFHRLSTYGRIIALRNVGWYRRNVFEGREDRSRAVEEAPRWLVRLCVWVFAGYMPLVMLSGVWAGLISLMR